MEDVVTRFCIALNSHDWTTLESTLAESVVRIGMRDNAEDTCRGRENYLQFARGVIGRFQAHEVETLHIHYSSDGRRAISEMIETIQQSGRERLSMRLLNAYEIDDDGLISKIDIFWKTPPNLPPDWITVDAVLMRQG